MINRGDIVYLNNDDSTRYIVLGWKEIGSSVFVQICDLENNGYCGWFNVNKIRYIQRYYPGLLKNQYLSNHANIQ